MLPFPVRGFELARLTALYFPLTVLFAALLTQVLPARVEAVVGADDKEWALGIVGAGGALLGTLSVVLVGALSDATTHRWGRRLIWIVGGLFVGIVGALLLPILPSLAGLLLAFVLVRVGFGAVVAAYEAVVPDRVPREQHAQAASWGEGWDLLGQVGGLLLALLVSPGRFNALAQSSLSPAREAVGAKLLVCGLAVMLLVVVFLFVRPRLFEPQLDAAVAPTVREAVRGLVEFRPSQVPDMWRLYLSRCALTCGTYTGTEFLRYYVGDNLIARGGDVTAEVTIIGLLVTVGGVGGALLVGTWGDRRSKKRLLWLFCVIAACAATMFVLAPNLTLVRGAAFVFGVAFSALSALNWAFATTLLPRAKSGRLLALYQTSFLLPQVWVLAFGGFFSSFYGTRALFATIPFYLLVSALLLTRVREENLQIEAI